jgi:hypothetical protein
MNSYQSEPHDGDVIALLIVLVVVGILAACLP